MISNCQLLNIWSFAPKSFKNCIFKHYEKIFLNEKLHLHWHNLYCCFEDHSVKLDLAEYPRNKVRLLSHPSEAPRPKRKAKPLSRPPLSFWTFVTLAQCHLIGVQTTCFSWSTTVAWPGRCVASFASHPTSSTVCTAYNTVLIFIMKMGKFGRPAQCSKNLRKWDTFLFLPFSKLFCPFSNLCKSLQLLSFIKQFI